MRGSDRLDRLLRSASVLLAFLLVGGTVLTKWFMGAFEGRPIGWVEALFFVLQTFTTVGYGELPPFTSLPMLVLALGLMVVGVSLVFLVGATLVAHWIEASIAPRPDRETRLRDHVVVTDHNPLVQDLLSSFEDEHVPFVVLEEDEERAVALQEDGGLPVVTGDPQAIDTLQRANLDEARGMLASGDDAENIGSILATRNFEKVPIVSRVERLEKARFPALAGADAVVSPEVAMGRALVDWTLAVPTPADWPPPIRVEAGAEAIDDLNPSVFYITEGSPLSEATVADVGARTDALIVGLWEGEQLTFNPEPETEVLGTAIIALGTEEEIRGLARMASEGEDRGSVVIVGYGNVGAAARERLVDAGVNVTVVDFEPRDVPDQVVGDATDLEVLREAGVDVADNLILALDDDNVALQVALEARVLNPDIRISARATTDRDVDRFRWAGVDHPISMATVSARMLMQALVREGAIDPPFDPCAARRPPGSLAGSILRDGDVRGRTGCLVLGLVDDEAVRPAHGSEPVHEDTEVLLLGTAEQLARFEDVFL